MKKYWFSVCVLLLLAACNHSDSESTAAPPPPTAASNPAAPPVSQLPIVRVVSEVALPFTERTEEAISGFDYELLKAIGEKEGFQPQFIPQAWANVFGTLEKGEADLLAGGVQITDEIKQRFEISQPYLETGTALLLGKNMAIKQFYEIRDKRVAVKTGSPAQESAQSAVSKTGVINVQPTLWLAINETVAGKSDATLGDAMALAYYANTLKDKGLILFTDTHLPKLQYGFMSKKGNTALLEKINRGLETIKQNGTYDSLYQKYFKDNAYAVQNPPAPAPK